MEMQLLVQLEYSAGNFDSTADYLLNSFVILMEVLSAVGRCHWKIFFLFHSTVFSKRHFLEVAAYLHDTAKRWSSS